MARNVAVATSRESGAQHLAAWLQPADGDHKSPLAANGDLKFARRAKILTISSTKRQRVLLVMDREDLQILRAARGSRFSRTWTDVEFDEL